MMKRNSWKPKHQTSRLARQVWIWKYEWAQRVKATVTTEGHVFHVQPKLIIGKGKIHTCPWMGHTSEWESTQTDWRATSTDSISGWKQSGQHALHFGWQGDINPTWNCVTSTRDRARGFTWDPSYQIWKLSHLLSLLAEQGSKDHGRQEGRTWSCPDSITLNYLMNKYSLFYGFNGRWTTTKNIRCSSCFQSLSFLFLSERIIHDFWQRVSFSITSGKPCILVLSLYTLSLPSQSLSVH